MIWRFCDLQCLVLGVVGVNGVASVIGVAAEPATSGKAREYAGYACYAPGQKSSEQCYWAANSVPETGFDRLLGRQRIARTMRGTGTGSCRGKSLPIDEPVSEQAH